MILVIAEKPSLGRDIAGALPGNADNGSREYIKKGDYVVTWVFGHMLTLKEPEDYDAAYRKWSLDELPIYFENWGLKIGADTKGFETKEHRVELIGSLLEQSDMVIHAGDPDEEGQLLIDELLDWFKYTKPVKRLNTSDTTRGGLKKALDAMRDNSEFVSEGRSAYARSVADMMVGVNLSRFFTCSNRGALLSVGRVQTPTLGLVVNRDLQIEGHTKCTYYDIFADVNVDFDGGKTVRAKYTSKQKDVKILSRAAAEKAAETLKEKKLDRIEIEQKTVEEDAPLPFNLVKLQSYCSSHFGYSPAETLDITQSLREKHKAITYNRSDCQYLSEEHYKEAPRTLEQVIKNISYRPAELDASIHSKCFNDDNITAHSAIIPTNQSVSMDALTEEEKNVYLAICKYYMAQFLPKAVKDKRKLTADADENYTLTAHSSRILKQGYLAIFREIQPEEETPLCDIDAGVYEGFVEKADIEEKETKPPSRYTKATLNEDMTRIAKYVSDPAVKQLLLDKDKDKKGENGSIGTSATRSSIIDGLVEKQYLREEGKKLISTELGRELYRILPDEIKQADLTAKWWSIQEDIRAGVKTPAALTENVLDTVKSIIRNEYPPVNQAVMTKHVTERYRTVIGTCPFCGGNVVEGAKGFGCSNWRPPMSCKFVIWKNYGGMLENVTITEAMAKKLLDGKQVKMKKLKSKTGELFDAEMKLEADASAERPVRLVFGEKAVLGKCPKCGGDVREGRNTFSCDNNCGFKIWKKTEYGPLRKITVSALSAKKWLRGEEVVSSRLVKKDGEVFKAGITMKYVPETDRVEYVLNFAAGDNKSE